MNIRITIQIALMCFISNQISAQYFQSGKTTITFTDITRNRQIPADIYYPSNTAGNNVPLANGTTKFPVVVFGHGFTIGTTSYAKLGDTLAKYGYVAAFPTTETGFSPSHDNFGKDLSFLCDALINTDVTTGSIFYNRLIHKAAVGGHSMGGGCSFLAAATQNPLMYCLFNMSAAETNPSSTSAASNVNIPTLIFSGSNDCIVAPSVQQSMYNNIISSCKSIANITGATHCQFADNNFNCTFGQISSGCNSSPISVSTVYDKVTALLIPFLDYHLKDNCYRGVDFVTTINSLSGITPQNTCPIPVCQILPLNSLHFYGKIIQDKAMLYWDLESTENVSYFELEKSKDAVNFEWLGKTAANHNLHYSISDVDFSSGKNFYRLKTISHNNEFVYSDIISLSGSNKLIEVSNVYPNPAKDFFLVNVSSKIQTEISTEIIDRTGNVLQKRSAIIKNGMNDIRFEIKQYPSGLYFVKFTDEKNKTIKITKFSKN